MCFLQRDLVYISVRAKLRASEKQTGGGEGEGSHYEKASPKLKQNKETAGRGSSESKMERANKKREWIAKMKDTVGLSTQSAARARKEIRGCPARDATHTNQRRNRKVSKEEEKKAATHAIKASDVWLQVHRHRVTRRHLPNTHSRVSETTITMHERKSGKEREKKKKNPLRA